MDMEVVFWTETTVIIQITHVRDRGSRISAEIPSVPRLPITAAVRGTVPAMSAEANARPGRTAAHA